MTDIKPKVPVHHLGICTILSYGFLFYAFAPLKTYIASASGLSEVTILTLISFAMICQSMAMPFIGAQCDRRGALRVMSTGFLLGATGVMLLGFTGVGVVAFLPSWVWLMLCFLILSFGLGMCAYDVAFSAAVQFDEKRSRRQISIITFYGGIASSVSWLVLVPLLSIAGFVASMAIISAVLLVTSVVIYRLGTRRKPKILPKEKAMEPFKWRLLNRTERKSLLLLATGGFFEYLMFSATALLLITWFNMQFQNLAWAVLLASLYGPFQVVGRMLEMRYAHHLDARITALIAYSLMPIALLLVQTPSVALAVIAMMLFGMSHGILTVSYGFVPNLYFRATVFGRARGWIGGAHVLGMSAGPSLGGFLFAAYPASFMLMMICISLASAAAFSTLLWLKPTNKVHSRKSAEA